MQDFKPLVSIIIPVYNGSNYLKSAIDSALSQTYKNIEIIVVNDGSKDNTEKIALSYGDKIRYFYKENGGVATALNFAVENSKGDYISWLSHDDIYYPDKIKKQVEFLEKLEDKNTILYSEFDTVDVEKNKKKTPLIFENTSVENNNNYLKTLKALFGSRIHGCTLLIPKTAFEKCGIFETNLKTTQDYKLWFKFLDSGINFQYMPDVLILSRIHNQQDTKKHKNSIVQSEVYALYELITNQYKEYIASLNPEDYEYFYNHLSLLRAYNSLAFEMEKTRNKYKFTCVQLGFSDLMGHKFNGHDLSKYLKEHNILSYNFVTNKQSYERNTFQIPKLNLNEIPAFLTRYTEFINADLLHIHFIHNTVFDITYLPLLTKLFPCVWTIHDPWALSGHCIHHFDCEKWKSHCCDCEKLDIPFAVDIDETALNFEIKKESVQNSQISAIAASNWMADKLKQSPIWKDKKIYIVPFGIDQSVFKPYDINEAKKELGIDVNKKVLFFRSETNEYKGLDILKDCLNKLKNRKDTAVITVGERGLIDEYKEFFEIHEFGWIENDEKLAKLYQACDIFLMPSKQESFGLMAIEAMSCAKMVLALNRTALTDTINTPECGIAVDISDYCEKLSFLLDNDEELKNRSQKSYQYAKEHYSKEIYIQKIISVYESVIADYVQTPQTKLILNQLRKKSVTASDRYDSSKIKIFEQKIKKYSILRKLTLGKLRNKYNKRYYDLKNQLNGLKL